MKIIRKLFTDSFPRDILGVLTVSIIIGAILSATVSFGANAYFSQTLSNLVGEYGEYDLVLQVREEMKEDSATHIQKTINDVFSGAKLKEGPTITGRTSFFVALPENYKTKQVYEDLGKTFGGIPGGAGVGVMTEPRLTVRGVPEGAKSMLLERISEMEGVQFAFHDGASIGVILTAVAKTTIVNEQINKLLKQYQVIEISFPVGSEPANPIRLGENIADAIKANYKLDYAQNVSIDGKNEDMTYLVSTMMELRKFLIAYRTKVILTPIDGLALKQGDQLVFPGQGTPLLAVGGASDKKNILVEITAVEGNKSAEGKIIQGDAALLTGAEGYKLENNIVTSHKVAAVCKNPRTELGNALKDAGIFVDKVPALSQDAQKISNTALKVLESYDNSMAIFENTLSSIQTASNTVAAVTTGITSIDTSMLQNQLDNSARTLGTAVTAMQVAKLLNADVGSTLEDITASQHNLISLKRYLGAIGNVAADAKKAKGLMDNITVSGRNALTQLNTLNVSSTKSSLTDIKAKLTEVDSLNSSNIAGQIAYLAAAVPKLTDEEINHSVVILDKFIAGQVIPGERIQILTTNNINVEAIAPTIYIQVGHNNVSLYSSVAGVIEPNPRAEIYQILSEVKATLAGMTAITLTIFLLVFDHTAIMTVIRRKRLENLEIICGWRKVVGKITKAFCGGENYYGMLIGSVLLTGMFLLSGGGIPYLPWLVVPILGGVIGLITAHYSEKISPVSGDEVMAGESLGMSFDQIMREIVIPNARPGLLQKMNTRKIKFH